MPAAEGNVPQKSVGSPTVVASSVEPSTVSPQAIGVAPIHASFPSGTILEVTSIQNSPLVPL